MSNGAPSSGESANMHTSLIQDNTVAEQMAIAAAPLYNELQAARDNLMNDSFRLSPQQIIERMSPYYVNIGMAMESARRDQLVGAATSPTMANVSAGSEANTGVSPDALLAAAHGPSFAETRSNLFEQNVGMLIETISSIFDTMPGAEWVQTEKSTDSQTGTYTVGEVVSLYDPYTGIMSTIVRAVEHSKAGEIKLNFTYVHDEFVPIPVGPPPKDPKEKARLLVNGRKMIFDEDGYRFLEKFSDNKEHAVKDNDPDFVAEWSTRLLRSTPVSPRDTKSVRKDYKSDYIDHIALSKYTGNTIIGAIYSEGIERHLDGEWLKKLATNHQQYEQLKKNQAPGLYPS
jgi:hypothetical protein